MDVMDPAYLRMRMKLIMSMWTDIQYALMSPWSNIRSICYGLICQMLKINVSDYPATDPAANTIRDPLSFQFSANMSPQNMSDLMGEAHGFSDKGDDLSKNLNHPLLSEIGAP
jgi:hypothetical protein